MDLQKITSVSIQARSLDIPNDAHPNRMPFSGILTRIGEPSDAAPEGAGGARVMITVEAAKKNLDSLLGMAVDYQADFSGHDPKAKIGVITSAAIEDNAIVIKGFIYAADFPELAAEIKANKDALGFSFEARDLLTNDAAADSIPIVDCVFTGAAILLKEKAAYRTTSLAAKAENSEEDISMSKEIQDQLAALAGSVTKIGEAVTALSSEVAEIKKAPEKLQAANFLSKVEPHAARVDKAADLMEQDGLGGHPTRGHATVLRKMAGCMRADAAQGKMPHVFEDTGWMGAAASETKKEDPAMDAAMIEAAVKKATEDFTKQLTEIKAAAEKAEKALKDELESTKTKLADLQAKAVKEVEIPQRKTLSVMASAMLSKTGIELPEEGKKLDANKLNEVLAKSGMTSSQRFQLKTEMAHAGLID
jgi:hypothetical protein